MDIGGIKRFETQDRTPLIIFFTAHEARSRGLCWRKTFLVEECFTFTPFLMILDGVLPSQMPSQAHSCRVGASLAGALAHRARYYPYGPGPIFFSCKPICISRIASSGLAAKHKRLRSLSLMTRFSRID